MSTLDRTTKKLTQKNKIHFGCKFPIAPLQMTEVINANAVRQARFWWWCGLFYLNGTVKLCYL